LLPFSIEGVGGREEEEEEEKEGGGKMEDLILSPLIKPSLQLLG